MSVASHFDRVRDAALAEFDLIEAHFEALLRARSYPPPERRKLGNAGLHAPKLSLSDYLESEAQPPAGVHRSNFGFNWGVLLNDKLGDCGECMAIHADECFHLDAGTSVPQYNDGDALTLYEEVGGYVPGDPSTDQGTDNSVLVGKWEQDGILCAADGQRRKIAHSLFVDPTDEVVSRIGIWEFVVLFRALGLPATAQTQNGHWKLTDPSLQGDAAVGSWGYHDVPYISYDSRRVRTITWGEEWLVDWAFDQAYSAGGFVVVTPEQLNLQGISPSGVNWSRLNADLAALPSAPA